MKAFRKFLKRTFIVLAILFLLLFIFRGFLYRSLVTYSDAGDRKSYVVTDRALAAYIDSVMLGKELASIDEVADLSQAITGDVLSFSLESKISDPNILLETRKANCVGYATFTAAVTNYIVNKQAVANEWEAYPKRGYLYCGPICLNKLFHNKYFKDHDFVLIRNTLSGEEMYIDSSVYDYLNVRRVNKFE